MTQEEKELLLKDLYSRLPYNPMVEYKGETYNVLGITHGRLVLCKPFMSITLDECPLIEEVKHYLFPMSSMTGDEVLEYISLKESIIASDDITYYFETYESIDWLNKNKFDYRGLIPMGLAIDATGLNIY